MPVRAPWQPRVSASSTSETSRMFPTGRVLAHSKHCSGLLAAQTGTRPSAAETCSSEGSRLSAQCAAVCGSLRAQPFATAAIARHRSSVSRKVGRRVSALRGSLAARVSSSRSRCWESILSSPAKAGRLIGRTSRGTITGAGCGDERDPLERAPSGEASRRKYPRVTPPRIAPPRIKTLSSLSGTECGI